MIRSFACKRTERFFRTGRATGFLAGATAKAASRKLQMLHFATDVCDLRVPPGNQLEPLKGDRAGWYSVRVNKQYRLCFRFDGGDAYDVEIVDYH